MLNSLGGSSYYLGDGDDVFECGSGGACVVETGGGNDVVQLWYDPTPGPKQTVSVAVTDFDAQLDTIVVKLRANSTLAFSLDFFATSNGAGTVVSAQFADANLTVVLSSSAYADLQARGSSLVQFQFAAQRLATRSYCADATQFLALNSCVSVCPDGQQPDRATATCLDCALFTSCGVADCVSGCPQSPAAPAPIKGLAIGLGVSFGFLFVVAIAGFVFYRIRLAHLRKVETLHGEPLQGEPTTLAAKPEFFQANSVTQLKSINNELDVGQDYIVKIDQNAAMQGVTPDTRGRRVVTRIQSLNQSKNANDGTLDTKQDLLLARDPTVALLPQRPDELRVEDITSEPVAAGEPLKAAQPAPA